MDERLRRHDYRFLEVASPPDSESLKKYYARNYYQSERGNYCKNYATEELEAINLRIELKAHRASQLRGHEKPGRLLDVGCGEGFVLAAFASRGWNVRGIDYSTDGVTSMNPDQVENVEQGDLFELLEVQVSSKVQYDLIWLGNVLEHIPSPIEVMHKIHAMVAPGGLLIVTVPNDGSDYQEHLLQSGAIPERFWITIPDHLSYFTSDSLARTARETGWTVSDIQGDFPIDLFLSHPGSNYIRDRQNAHAAHSARLKLENFIGGRGADAANAFYSALAEVGLGRNITVYLKPNQTSKGL